MDSSSDDEGPKVVKFSDKSHVSTAPVSKREKKLYLSASAPKEIKEATPSRRKPTKQDEDDVKNDSALQRLLDESHILSEANKYTGADISNIDFDPIGKSRHKTMERRLDQLGVKSKNKGQHPMSMAKGLKNAELDRKKKTISEAKEAGIVLAKTYKVDKKKADKRQRGLQIQSVGRNTKHGLVVSEKEIAKYTRKKGSRK